MPISTTDHSIPRSDPSDLHHPRLLCLHGGGTNARIFRAQCRSLRAQLAGSFRLIFADAPFYSIPGPDVESVYAEWGPFRSWVRSTPAGIPIEWGPRSLDVDAVDDAIYGTIEKDNALGATGKIVGVIGFSQGAKMAGCLLLRQQEENERRKVRLGKSEVDGLIRYEFAVLIAGRGPLTTLDSDALPARLPLRLPTIHVHGVRDKHLTLHQALLSQDCARENTRVIEWDGDHRVPIKTKDVAQVVGATWNAAKDAGIQ